MVGAKGFEPSTSWSRNRVAKILKALSGVAYEIETADFSLSVVPKLYLDFWHEPIIGWRERLPSKEAGEIHACFAELRLQVSLSQKLILSCTECAATPNPSVNRAEECKI